MNIIIAVEEQDKEERIPIHHKASLQKKASSTWSWHKEFIVAWSETFLIKKRKKTAKK